LAGIALALLLVAMIALGEQHGAGRAAPALEGSALTIGRRVRVQAVGYLESQHVRVVAVASAIRVP